MSESAARASKRQQELLQFVREFIAEHNYGPSYREIMRSLNYKSVSTVAIHIDALIAKGYLRKTNNSARSLELVSKPKGESPDRSLNHKEWLQQTVGKAVAALDAPINEAELLEIERMLRTLGLDKLVDVEYIRKSYNKQS